MTKDIQTAKTAHELRTKVEGWKRAGETLALVPTMGALHEGHLSLVRLAGQGADRVIVSIFVNPKQFAQGEDLETYPRDLASDLQKLADEKVDLVYAPGPGEVYPPGFQTKISVEQLSKGLCSGTRPHFFDGVATVVTRLLLQCTPDRAIFGEKDYQQLLVIRQLVRDLSLPVEIIGAPLVREADGLALSSRNAYLSEDERRVAPLLHRVLAETAVRLRAGQSMSEAAADGLAQLRDAGFRPDYFELRHGETLEPLQKVDREPARLLIAATLGTTRLIDNIAVLG